MFALESAHATRARSDNNVRKANRDLANTGNGNPQPDTLKWQASAMLDRTFQVKNPK